jgi:hypothetical protein
MRKILTAAAALVAVTLGSSSFAQNTPPGTDRPGGETSTQSAQPKMQKGKSTKAVKKKKTKRTSARKMGTPTPPGTDRPSGESGATSAKPRPQ